MSTNALNDFLDLVEKEAADMVENEVKDTENATGDLKDDSIKPAETGERAAENEAGMKAMHTQMVDNTEDGATAGEPTAPDGTNAKGTGEDPANENADYENKEGDNNPPLITDVEKRVMKEGAVKVAGELSQAVLKYASELIEELAVVTEKQAGAQAAEMDLRL